MKWKDLWTNLTINNKSVAMTDLKAEWCDIFAYEMNRLFASAEFKVRVIGEWPLEKSTLPLITITRLSDGNDQRFLGDAYAESHMAQRQAAKAAGTAPEGLTASDPGQAVEGWLFNEVLEVRAWSDNKEIADSLYVLNKAIVMAWSGEMMNNCDLQELHVFGGRDERALEQPSGRAIYWRPFNIAATVPAKLVESITKVEAVRVNQQATKSIRKGRA